MRALNHGPCDVNAEGSGAQRLQDFEVETGPTAHIGDALGLAARAPNEPDETFGFAPEVDPIDVADVVDGHALVGAAIGSDPTVRVLRPEAARAKRRCGQRWRTHGAAPVIRSGGGHA